MAIDQLAAAAFRVKGLTMDQASSYHLGIILGPDVSGWVVRDVRNAMVIAMAWAPDGSALQHADLPRHPRQVTYVSLPEWSTLVPTGALEEGTGAHHLALVHGKLPNTTVREEPMSTVGAQCLFVNEAHHERQVLGLYPNARSLPLQAVLVNGAQTRSHGGPTLLLHRGAQRSDIAIADRGELLLSSSYPARTPEDVLYFCLMTTEQCGLEPQDVALRSGGTHLSSDDRPLLDRYFKDHAPALSAPPALGANDAAVARLLAAFDQFACVS